MSLANLGVRNSLIIAVLAAFPCFSFSLENNGAIAPPQLDMLPPIGGNKLPLLSNRFRIDHRIDSITLIFFRERGTPPIILVRPDGSKIYLGRHPEETVEWFDSVDYDLIKMKSPMPGPWQAVGQLKPGSKIMVMSELKLEAEDLPEDLMAGETVKVLARLTNGGQRISSPEFASVVMLDVTFTSTNRSDMDNFAADPQKITAFKDDGQGLDEKPRDGVFTGEFELDIPAGEWIPSYQVATPLFSRQLDLDKLIVHRAPITIDVEKGKEDGDYHQVYMKINESLVQPDALAFQGKVYYPNGDVQSVSIADKKNGRYQLEILNYDYGIFRIDLEAFGTNQKDREFMLKVPTFTFQVEPPPPSVIDPCAPQPEIIDEETGEVIEAAKPLPKDCLKQISDSLSAEEGGEASIDVDSPGDEAVPQNAQTESTETQTPDDMAVADMPAEQNDEDKLSGTSLLLIILGGNIGLLLLGFLLFKFVIFRKPGNKKPKKQTKAKKAKKEKSQKEKDEGAKETKSEQKNGESDEIIDLSMPDE